MFRWNPLRTVGQKKLNKTTAPPPLHATEALEKSYPFLFCSTTSA